MSEEPVEKTPLERSRDVISQLKEMRHYSQSNIEKLSEIWLLLDDELKQKDIAKRVEALVSKQTAFQEAIDELITDYEMQCNRMENEGT
jgi:hypothetical protein